MGSHIVVFIIVPCKDEGKIRRVLCSIIATDCDAQCCGVALRCHAGRCYLGSQTGHDLFESCLGALFSCDRERRLFCTVSFL